MVIPFTKKHGNSIFKFSRNANHFLLPCFQMKAETNFGYYGKLEVVLD